MAGLRLREGPVGLAGSLIRPETPVCSGGFLFLTVFERNEFFLFF
jgi:hypothetical protein